ncbi:MAG: nucleotidyltransferase family protein [Isosphaeraceae bacterium]|nr:nucleotidyltransferase family protein [Isosphaeraceae bacterium]
MIVAIVPAAGHSERMGRPKLILPVGGQTVIARVTQALLQGGAGRVVVVTPPSDAPGSVILAREAEKAGALVVVPAERPIDMRASFERGLDALAGVPDVTTLLLAPGDSVGVTAELVARVVACARQCPDALVVPVVQGLRGHPVALPRSIAEEVRSLPLGVGINTLIKLQASAVVELPVNEPGAVADLDTPEDYQRWTEPDDG